MKFEGEQSLKKSEIIRQYDLKATVIFISAAAALFANAVFTAIQSIVNISNNTFGLLLLLIAAACMIFANIITIKGFKYVDKACRLCEENENYFLGRNLMVFSVLSFILTIVLTFVSLFFNLILVQYQNAPGLTTADLAAQHNITIVLAMVLIVLQIVTVSTPYIFYLWRIHKSTPKTDSINNFALLTMMIMIVQLCIGILSSCYSIMGKQISFLAGFASVLLVVKYLVLALFFIARRKTIVSPRSDAEVNDEKQDKSTEEQN